MGFSHKSFEGSRAAILSAIEAARNTLGLLVVWIMKGGAVNKLVRPGGIAIVSASQIQLSGMAEHYLKETA